MRASVEIDAYPTNARQWEAQHGVEASEEINANFGYGSQFHETHGYYVDGIDEATAKLPLDWRDRQHSTAIECDGRIVWAITPDISDLVVSKLCRLDPRDAEYIEILHAQRPLDLSIVRLRLTGMDIKAAVRDRAIDFIEDLSR